MNTKTRASPENIACPKWLQDMNVKQIHEHYVSWPQRQRTEWDDALEDFVHTEGPDKGRRCIDGMFDEGLYNLVLQIHLAAQQWKTLTRINEPRLIPDKAERLNKIERHLMRLRLKTIEGSWLRNHSDDLDEERKQMETALNTNKEE